MSQNQVSLLLTILVLGLAADPSGVRARETGDPSTRSTSVKSCNDDSLDLRSVPVGFKCRASAGAVFERVMRPSLGRAWRDSGGTIWGQPVRTTDGAIWRTDHRQADAYCHRIRARLPSREDFARIRQAVGSNPDTPGTYDTRFENHKALPLQWYSVDQEDHRRYYSLTFWSSTMHPDGLPLPYTFDVGRRSGEYEYENPYYDLNSVRCVSHR